MSKNPAPDSFRSKAASPDLGNYQSAYGNDIAPLLQSISQEIRQTSQQFVDHFYNELEHRKAASELLSQLTPEESEHLRHQQARYLEWLTSPDLTPDEHLKRAFEVGHAHEMVGVSLPTLLDAYHLYQQEFDHMLSVSSLSTAEQGKLSQALLLRLMLDMEVQINYHYRVDMETAAFLSRFDKVTNETDNHSDLLHGITQTMVELDGVIACIYLRPDRQGTFQIEAAGGAAGLEYAESMQQGIIPQLQTRKDVPAGQGPAGKAWRSRQIQLLDSFENTPGMNIWAPVGTKLGFRSSASLPLIDEAGEPFAMLAIYSPWPGFFSTTARQTMLSHLQQMLSHAVLQFENKKVVSVTKRRIYRDRLRKGALEMHYQPIVNLKTGRPEQFEALARLRDPAGQLIYPGTFLPAFGKTDLFDLFKLGLRCITQDWNTYKIGLPVSLNLPAEGITDDAYRDSLFEILEQEDFDPRYLKLEMLETEGPYSVQKRDLRIKEFHDAGLEIVQDDLGSGYSSLLRMKHIAFNAIKIDQGLVRSAVKAPQGTLEFIYHLTRLTHSFNVSVTVEGLENDGLIEAAAILGADYGQGFGIARPMPASRLAAWEKRVSLNINPQSPRTPLGALAGYLLWDQQLHALTHWPELLKDFVKTPCLVQRYLDHTKPDNQTLNTLLEHNHACALNGPQSAPYRQTRQSLIENLEQQWLQELAI